MRGIVALGLIAALSGRAVADRDPVVAKRLFSEGRVLYDQGKFIEACVLFEKSFELDPAVGTKLNLAECAERDHKPRAAWLMWTSAADEFERKSDKRSKFARSRADALGPKLATVIVKLAKPKQRGLTIQIAGRVVAPALVIVDRLEPGAIKVVAQARERESFETVVTAVLGEKLSVDVPALAMVSGPDPDEEPDPPPDPPEKPPETPPETMSPTRNWWKTAALAGGAVTVLSATGYLFAAFKIRSIERDIDAQMPPFDFDRINTLNSEGFTWQSRARTALGITAGLAVVTTALVLKARSVDRRATVTPMVSSQTVGAQLELRW